MLAEPAITNLGFLEETYSSAGFFRTNFKVLFQKISHKIREN